MRRRLSKGAALLIAAALVTGGAVSQEMEGITVEAKRVETTEVKTPGIVPEYLLRASYRVTYEDLDVSTQAGRDEVKRRVEKAADLACREIQREYPFAEPRHQQCASEAARRAMAEFKTRVAAR
jgi:UrcA family protein